MSGRAANVENPRKQVAMPTGSSPRKARNTSAVGCARSPSTRCSLAHSDSGLPSPMASLAYASIIASVAAPCPTSLKSASVMENTSSDMVPRHRVDESVGSSNRHRTAWAPIARKDSLPNGLASAPETCARPVGRGHTGLRRPRPQPSEDGARLRADHCVRRRRIASRACGAARRARGSGHHRAPSIHRQPSLPRLRIDPRHPSARPLRAEPRAGTARKLCPWPGAHRRSLRINGLETLPANSSNHR